MRVVFIGTPDFSVPSLDKLVTSGYNVVGVITAPDRKSGRGMKLQKSAVKQYAESKNLTVLQPTNLKSEDFIESLKALKADVQVVIAFRMLPEIVWNMPKYGTINLHASLLPNYRGAAPINWAIINGEKVTGLTTFRLKHEIDTGDILMRKELAISNTETAGELHDRMMVAGADLILDTLDAVRTNQVKETPQVVGEMDKAAPKIFKETCEIDWQKSGRDIYNLVRGLSPYPAARTQFHDKILKVFSCSFTEEIHDRFPGTYDTDNATYLCFYCKDGVVQLQDVQLEGKRRMLVEDLLRGFQNSL